uniref:Uncharacterized protein n=1 Tax=Trypanosoma congolense (strain IL3000) TaxID=1068625 RepID=G0UIQ3_TRYCI|nr:conserved hypothetical protein [Trypanosoma congolense IL3000]
MRNGQRWLAAGIGRFLEDDKTFASCMRVTGVGVSPSIRCCFSLHALRRHGIFAAGDIPSSFVVAAVPATRVWTVESVHDDDVEGLMPSLQTCRDASMAARVEHIFDILYLSLYFSVRACHTFPLWSQWQRQLGICDGDDHATDNMKQAVAGFLQSLRPSGLTPPTELLVTMCRYTRRHSCRLSKDGSALDFTGGPVLAVMPMVDLALPHIKAGPTLMLRRCAACELRTLIKKNSLKYLRRSLAAAGDEAAYWVMETKRAVSVGEQLSL